MRHRGFLMLQQVQCYNYIKEMNKPTINKKVINATPLTYDGIKFRSKLEVFCYQKLKEFNIPFEYESERYPLLESFIFQGYEYPEKIKKSGENYTTLGITYTPDFVINKNIVIECKGFADAKFPLKWKMFKKEMEDKFGNNCYLFIVKNQKQVLESLNKIKNIIK